MRKKLFNLVNIKTKKVEFSGSYEQCWEKLGYKIEYTGKDIEYTFKATTNDGKVNIGTMEKLAKIYKTSVINMYNYTRYKREFDGLFVVKVEE